MWRVNDYPAFSMNDYTTYGEVILVPHYAVVKQPKGISFSFRRPPAAPLPPDVASAAPSPDGTLSL